MGRASASSHSKVSVSASEVIVVVGFSVEVSVADDGVAWESEAFVCCFGWSSVVWTEAIVGGRSSSGVLVVKVDGVGCSSGLDVAVLQLEVAEGFLGVFAISL